MYSTILLRHWGEDGEVEALPGELDSNFLVTGPDGTRSILKIMHPVADPTAVDLQISALEHLAGTDLRARVPRVIPWLNGAESGVTPVPDENGEILDRIVWRLSWLDGTLMAESAPWTPMLCRSLGRFLAELDRALEDFTHFAADRQHLWDPAQGGRLVEAVLGPGANGGPIESPPSSPNPDSPEAGDDPQRRARIERICHRFRDVVAPRLSDLPRQVIHADANDWNLLVDRPDYPTEVTGIFDFGDMLRTARVCEPAVAAAYAAGNSLDPVGTIAEVFGGYHEVNPLTEDEIAVGVDLVKMRLAISATMSATRRHERPDDAYVTVSEEGVWRAINHLDAIHPRLATARVRKACGLEPWPTRPAVTGWLDRNRGSLSPVIDGGLSGRFARIDLSFETRMLGPSPDESRTTLLGQRIDAFLAEEGVAIGLGLWDEARTIYLGGIFEGDGHPVAPTRTIHMGVDLFIPAGTEVFLPLDGVVESLGDNGPEKDYGPVVLFRHEPDDCPVFWTLWGHLDHELLDRLKVGDRVRAGERVGLTGAPPFNGDWPPHPHIQMVLDPLDRGHDFAGVAGPDVRDLWAALSPNPASLIGLADADTIGRRPDIDELIERRARRTGRIFRSPIAPRSMPPVVGCSTCAMQRAGPTWTSTTTSHTSAIRIPMWPGPLPSRAVSSPPTAAT